MLFASILFLFQAAPLNPQKNAAEIIAPVAFDASPMTLFDQVCLHGLVAFPEEVVDQIDWRDFPSELRYMNTYGHPGLFVRTKADGVQYISASKGPSHIGPGITALCAVGTQKIDYDSAVLQIADKYGVPADKSPLEIDGLKVANMFGDNGIFNVVSAKDGWVIIRKMDMRIELSEEDAKKYIKQKNN